MKKKSSFIILYDPYSQKINDTFDEKLKRYIEDNGKTITIENTLPLNNPAIQSKEKRGLKQTSQITISFQ